MRVLNDLFIYISLKMLYINKNFPNFETLLQFESTKYINYYNYDIECNMPWQSINCSYQIILIQSLKTLFLNEKITNEFEGCGTHAYDKL